MSENYDLSDLFDDWNGVESGPPPIEKQPVKAGKVVLICFLSLIFCGIFYLIVGTLYTNYIRFPKQEYIDPLSTGAYAIDQFEEMIHSGEGITEDDYLLKERVYANSNKVYLSFIEKVIATVHYSYDTIEAKNIYGNPMVDRETGEIVMITSPVWGGEAVNLSYVDYASVAFPEEGIAKAVTRYGLTADDVDYSNILTEMFCYYISEMDELPIATERRIPELEYLGGAYAVRPDEDVYLDKLLFSSEEFLACQIRFTEAVGKYITGDVLSPSDEWLAWSELPPVKQETTNEPLKYGKHNIKRNWCGAFYIINEYFIYNDNGEQVKGDDKPLLGDGTFENPAARDTPVVSYVINEFGEKLPIRIEMVQYGVSADAINWFQTKDVQNRGYILDSEVQYVYAIFKITNLSSTTVTVSDNGSLCDKNANLSPRTGIIYGIRDTVVLRPDEEGYVEFWSRSTELHKKYLIWGADFARRIEPVWFRVLAGDLEDESEYKGVHVITPGGNEQESTLDDKGLGYYA